MASRSPARYTMGGDANIGANPYPPMGESALPEFDGGFPKSPMRDRFLNDLDSIPNARTRSNDVTRSPMRDKGSGDFGYGGAGKSPNRESKTPERPVIEDNIGVNSPDFGYGGAGKSPARQRNFSNLPIRESKTPERPVIGDEFGGGFRKSPMRDRFLNDLDSIPSSDTSSRDVTRSPMREKGSGDFGYGGAAGKSPIRESKTPERPVIRDEFDGGFSKSPMRDRFLSDLGSVPSSPMRSTHVSRSPMRGTVRGDLDDDDDDGSFGKSPMTQRDVSQSPIRQSKPGVSVRSKNVSRSPMRDAAGLDGVGKSPARSTAGDFPKSPMRRGLVSEFSEENTSDVDKESKDKKLTVKSSFSLWLPDNEPTQTNDSYSRRGRRPWREQIGVGDVDQTSESRESAQGYDHKMTSEGSTDDHVHAINPRRKGLYRDGFQGEDVGGGYPTSQATNYRPNSRGSYGESGHSFDSPRVPANVRELEMERAELFRRYKELSEQLEGNRVLPSSGLYGGTDEYLDDDEFGRFKARSMQQFVPGRGVVRRPAYFSSGPVPHAGDMYDDPFSGPSMSRPRTRQMHQHSNYGGRFDYDSPNSYLDERHYHHPSCSCPQCYTDDWQGRDLPYSMAGRRSTHSMDLGRNNPRSYNYRMAQSNPLERKSHHQRRSQLLNPNKKLCVPICGGAPFVLCKGCFVLLELPRKIMIKRKNHQYKFRCGGCSAVVSPDLQRKSLSFFPTNPSQDFVEEDDSDVLAKEVKESPQDEVQNSCDATSTNIGSCDFDAIGNSFLSMDSEVSKAQRLGTNLAENLSPSSSSRSSSKDDRASDNASVKSSLPNSTEMPAMKINLLPPPPGSPLRDLLDHSTHYQTLQAGGNSEKVKDEEAENRTVASEMEVQSQEGPPASFSQDEELPRKEEDDEIRSNKDGGSSVTGSVSSNGRTEVYVNGQCIPPQLVKKAEKFAGTIEPGEYWYDSKAGFWGVMGHRCLGIIPPSIPEFRFSLPGNCSGGDSAVFVNGRELHKKDLDILVGRGLPATRNKRYIVDISGKVLDEGTKRPVVNLGKLAPTVERKRRGFGMQVPDHFDNE